MVIRALISIVVMLCAIANALGDEHVQFENADAFIRFCNTPKRWYLHVEHTDALYGDVKQTIWSGGVTGLWFTIQSRVGTVESACNFRSLNLSVHEVGTGKDPYVTGLCDGGLGSGRFRLSKFGRYNMSGWIELKDKRYSINFTDDAIPSYLEKQRKCDASRNCDKEAERRHNIFTKFSAIEPRIRAVSGRWAAASGLGMAIPTFEETKKAGGCEGGWVHFGVFGVSQEYAETIQVTSEELSKHTDNFSFSDLTKAAHKVARDKGYLSAFPNMEHSDRGGKRYYGICAIKKGYGSIRHVSRTDLTKKYGGNPNDPEQLMRLVHRWSHDRESCAFPTFQHIEQNGERHYEIVFAHRGVAKLFDFSVDELNALY